MDFDLNNPLCMVPDPYDGKSFIFPPTLCSNERKSWFRRANEIIGFLSTCELALEVFRSKYESIFTEGKLAPNTPFKIEFSDGRVIIMGISQLIERGRGATDILYRQIFVMLYGSLETYMFELLERSFLMIGVNEKILDKSLEIMMKKNWDGKLCKMNGVFDLNYKARDLTSHFQGFTMRLEDKTFDNPLVYLDELAQIRHKIVHASSILEEGKYININANLTHAWYAFHALLTEHIDKLFAQKFNYSQTLINPAMP